MRMSAEDLVQITRHTISTLVLPNMKQNSWEAGYLKSALVLLACAQAQIGAERSTLAADTAAAAALLQGATTRLGASALGEALAKAFEDIVGANRLDPLTADIAELGAENARFGAGLNQLIVWLHEAPKTEHMKGREEIAALLTEYNSGLIARQKTLFSEAAGLPIF
jgi:hypothetical protein